MACADRYDSVRFIRYVLNVSTKEFYSWAKKETQLKRSVREVTRNADGSKPASYKKYYQEFREEMQRVLPFPSKMSSLLFDKISRTCTLKKVYIQYIRKMLFKGKVRARKSLPDSFFPQLAAQIERAAKGCREAISNLTQGKTVVYPYYKRTKGAKFQVAPVPSAIGETLNLRVPSLAPIEEVD